MVLSGRGFEKRSRNSNDLYLISQVKEIHSFETWQSLLLVIGTLSMVILSALDLVPLFISLSLLLPLMVAAKMLTLDEIKRKLDLNLALLIGFALALGVAMSKTGTSNQVAEFLLAIIKGENKFSLFLAIFALTNVFSAFLTSKAGVAILFPIVLALAKNLGADPIPFVLILAFGAAANFLTPIGYQTNLMVFGPGGYKFRDYFKVGLPLTIYS